MCLSLHSPVSLFSSITSLLPYAGVDNSRLPSLSQEPLPCPEVALLQTAPPCSAWIRQGFWGQQFPRLPSFLFWPTFPFSHSFTFAPMLLLPLPPCSCCSQLLLPPILAFSSLPWVLCCLPVPCRWTLPPVLRPSPWPPWASLLYNNMRTRGTMITAFVAVDQHTEDLVG